MSIKLDREARNVTEEDLGKLPAWRKFAAFLREVAIFSVAGGVLSVGCEIAQTQIRVLPKVNKEIAKYLEPVPEEIVAKNKDAAAQLRTLADEVAARPMPEKIVKHVESKLVGREKRVLDLLGNTQESKKLLKLADDNVARIIGETDLYVRINQENLGKVIRKERFTNAFENLEEGIPSGISHVNNPALKKLPRSRYNAEKNLFGIKESAKGYERPIYGYLSRGGEYLSTEEGSVVSHYGDVAVKLKSVVKQRATITPDDSASINTRALGMSASKYKVPKASSFISDEYLSSSIPEKPIEVANGLAEVSKANNINDLINTTGQFWGRKLESREMADKLLTSEKIGDIAKQMRSKGIEYGSDEYKKEMEKILREIAKSSERVRTAYVEFQSHGGLLAEDIEEIFMEEINHGALQKQLKAVRDLRAGLEVKNKPPQDFIDMVNWADMMGVKISGKKAVVEIPIRVEKTVAQEKLQKLNKQIESLESRESAMIEENRRIIEKAKSRLTPAQRKELAEKERLAKEAAEQREEYLNSLNSEDRLKFLTEERERLRKEGDEILEKANKTLERSRKILNKK